MNKKIAAVVTIVALLGAGIMATMALGTVNTYYGPRFMNWDYAYPSNGWSNKTWNRVYRPIGYRFALWYNDNGAQYAENSQNNPFWHQKGLNNAQSWCANVATQEVAVSPVTCQFGS